LRLAKSDPAKAKNRWNHPFRVESSSVQFTGVEILNQRFSRLLASNGIRHLTVGVVNTAFGFGIFTSLVLLSGEGAYLAILAASHIIASSLGFFLYRRFVFQVQGKLVQDFLRLQGVYAVTLGANAVILAATIELLGWSPIMAQALFQSVIFIGSYFGHKYFSFRRPKSTLTLGSKQN
jgi:putative flippase GtrA